MDSTDIKILNYLRKNARANASLIGEQINMSVSAVIERIRKLESAGIIRGYTVALDSAKIGMDVIAFISVGIEHPKYNEGFMDFINRNSRITESHYITGDFDFILKVYADSTACLEKVLNEIKSVQGVNLTRTNIVLSTVKDDSTVLIDVL